MEDHRSTELPAFREVYGTIGGINLRILRFALTKKTGPLSASNRSVPSHLQALYPLELQGEITGKAHIEKLGK